MNLLHNNLISSCRTNGKKKTQTAVILMHIYNQFAHSEKKIPSNLGPILNKSHISYHALLTSAWTSY